MIAFQIDSSLIIKTFTQSIGNPGFQAPLQQQQSSDIPEAHQNHQAINHSRAARGLLASPHIKGLPRKKSSEKYISSKHLAFSPQEKKKEIKFSANVASFVYICICTEKLLTE